MSKTLKASSVTSPQGNTLKPHGETINVREILRDPRIIEKLHDNIRDEEVDISTNDNN